MAAVSGIVSAMVVVAWTGVYFSSQPHAASNSTEAVENSTTQSFKSDRVGMYQVDFDKDFDYEENSVHNERREKIKEVLELFKLPFWYSQNTGVVQLKSRNKRLQI